MSEAVEKRHSSKKNAIYTLWFWGEGRRGRILNSKPDKFGLHLDRSIARVQRDIYSCITDLSFWSL